MSSYKKTTGKYRGSRASVGSSKKLSKEQREYVKASKEIDNMIKDPKYKSFVKKLGKAIEDPKVRSLLIKGRQDGLLRDDLVRTKTSVRKMSAFRPIQAEIDLAKSLKWIGHNPENVMPLLQGKTLTEDNFAGQPIVSSKGKYIIDGHHRWSQSFMINPNAKLETVDLQISKPEEALRISQITVGALTGEVVFKEVAKGHNIYRMSVAAIKRNLPNYLSTDFYEAFYKVQPKKFKTRADVHDYLVGNIKKLRSKHKPITQYPRGYMPQYDKVDMTHAKKAMRKGEVNVAPPYIKE